MPAVPNLRSQVSRPARTAREASCNHCHIGPGQPPRLATISIKSFSRRVVRLHSIIPDQPLQSSPLYDSRPPIPGAHFSPDTLTHPSPLSWPRITSAAVCPCVSAPFLSPSSNSSSRESQQQHYGTVWHTGVCSFHYCLRIVLIHASYF